MSDFLEKIRTLTEARVARDKLAFSSFEPSKRVSHDFAAKLLSAKSPAVIAEVKRASPSFGKIAMDLDPVEVAKSYFAEGAAAISVLTEPTYFGGSIETLKDIRKALPDATLLMKDFIIDHYQLLQARAAGADAVLLMISLLGAVEFTKLFHAACEIGLTPLVEVHDEAEMQIALAVNAPVIGVNNRNLRTLKVSVETSRQLAPMKTAQTIFVSESGIESRSMIDELTALGFNAFLIGSALMKDKRPGPALREILKEKLEIKICGITRKEDALKSAELGATMIGLIFAKESSRRTDVSTAREIVNVLPVGVRAIGIFVSEENLIETVKSAGLHGVQFHDFEPSPQLVLQLKKLKVLTIRAFAVDNNSTNQIIENSSCDLILLDTPRGSGRVALSNERVKQLAIKRKFLIAGGLSSENIAGYLKDLNPSGVDVASGVEQMPGIKSEEKLRHLFNEIKRVHL